MFNKQAQVYTIATSKDGKTLKAKIHPTNGLYQPFYEEGGNLPQELTGRGFTSLQALERAYMRYAGRLSAGNASKGRGKKLLEALRRADDEIDETEENTNEVVDEVNEEVPEEPKKKDRVDPKPDQKNLGKGNFDELKRKTIEEGFVYMGTESVPEYEEVVIKNPR
jgi:hypothetical protein